MLNIVPQPVSIITNSEKKGFTLHAGTTVSPYPFVEDFIHFVRKNFNKKIQIHEDTGEEKSIILKLDETMEHDEGYTLKCENRRVYITAKTESGLFYGLQTLSQMLLQKGGKLPWTQITDYPRFSYRGFMLDCGKSFLTVDELKRIVELMALHKLNVLHWNLTKNYGSTSTHNGYYTIKDMREIVEYCHLRKIKVIPEYDISENKALLNTDRDNGEKYIFGILDELTGIFFDNTVCLGEDIFQDPFWKKAADYLKSKGFSVTTSHNGVKKGVSESETDIAWLVNAKSKNEDYLKQEAKHGRKLINASIHPYSFDFPHGANTLKAVCDNDCSLTENDGDTYGVEAQMRTAYISNMKRLEYLTFPRLAAMAENAWAEKDYPSFTTFLHKAPTYYNLLDAYKINYAPLKKACPSFLSKYASALWFKRHSLFHGFNKN